MVTFPRWHGSKTTAPFPRSLHRTAPHRQRSRLHVEVLEDRCVPSTVTNLMDSGPGSLRGAIATTPLGGTVDFQPGLTGTITTRGLAINNDLTIAGPGADVITVSGNHSNTVFIVAQGVTAAISGLTVADGSTAGIGGGILNSGTLAISGSTIRDNYSISNGAGIFNGGTLSISGSTISGNFTEVRVGAGIFNHGRMTILDSAVSDNGHGGAIENQGPLTILNSTVSGNEQGGIDDSSISTLGNTIVAGNLGGDIGGPVMSLGYNLIGDGSHSSGFTDSDLVGTAQNPIDPLLGPLAANGAPTPTMAPLPGSPALNAGDPADLGNPDQRGLVRSGGVNIGAYQASASAFLFTAPAKVKPGIPFDVTVIAVDALGQVAVGYLGTVTFSTTDPDPGVALPADYAFTAADGGMHTFANTGLGEVSLVTHGYQTITVSDTAAGSLVGSVTVKLKRAHRAGSLSDSTLSPQVYHGNPPSLNAASLRHLATAATEQGTWNALEEADLPW